MSRQEYLEWSKIRAIQEMDFYKDPNKAIVSMMSDLRKHPETNNETLISLCEMMLLSGKIRTRQEAINFLNGFN